MAAFLTASAVREKCIDETVFAHHCRNTSFIGSGNSRRHEALSRVYKVCASRLLSSGRSSNRCKSNRSLSKWCG